MKIGDLVKLREECIEGGYDLDFFVDTANLRGLVIEANCHLDEDGDGEDVLVMWNRPMWTGVKGEYNNIVNHDIAEVEVVANESR